MIYTLQYLRSHDIEDNMVNVDGNYYPARPFNGFLFSRVRAAWEVLRGRADAFRWPASQ
jgi:hypothetical protein